MREGLLENEYGHKPVNLLKYRGVRGLRLLLKGVTVPEWGGIERRRREREGMSGTLAHVRRSGPCDGRAG